MFGILRFVLALMVVANHLGGYYMYGRYAVFGFFALSGYLMTLIMHESYGYTKFGKTAYAQNRFLRIFPLYWLSLLFTLALILVAGEQNVIAFHPAMHLPDSIKSVLENIFLLFFDKDTWPRMTPPSWALTVELFFYLCIGLGLSKTKKITLVWLFGSLTYHAYCVINNAGQDAIYFPFLAASLPFSTGATLYHYKSEISSFIRTLPSRIRIAAPFLIFTAVIVNLLALNQFSPYFHYYLNFLLLTLLIISLLEYDTTRLIRKLDKELGNLSYPIYLFHYQVGLTMILILALVDLEVPMHSNAMLVYSIPLLLIVSYLVSITIDRKVEGVRTKIKAS